MIAIIKISLKKELKILAASLVCGIILAMCLGYATKAYSETVQESIAKEVLRFHVLANSDEEKDQELKLKVRDGVLETFKEGLSMSSSVDETRKFLSARLNDIEARAEEIVLENGYSYKVSASLSHDFFPTKTYGDITFPPGSYEALRLVIGEGEGKNWWCVMFPPLCFVDVTKGKTTDESKSQLQSITTASEYKLLSDDAREQEVTVKVKFKVVEWWQNILRKRSEPDEPKQKSYVLKDLAPKAKPSEKE
ncbi:MAG: stage II sporulation protein R [Clostridiales bacterium]|jgi:stage II sporulation protein R|nr:stage II sporulation protein R [Clostridiales bacterium]